MRPLSNRMWLLPLVTSLVACGATSQGSSGQGSPQADGGGDDLGAPDAAPNADGGAPAGDAGVTQRDSGRDGSTADAAPSMGGPLVGGCSVFPPAYPYNQDISKAALDPGSDTYIANLAARAGTIDAPVGVSEYVNVVPSSQADVSIQFGSGSGQWGFDANDAFYTTSASAVNVPVPSGVLYENSGTPNSDHHMIVVVQGSCRLFELYGWDPSSATSGWSALVTWNLGRNEQLPDGYGSTTAAGTPLLAGIIRYEEVAAGEIPHALDIVIPGADLAAGEYVKPAARSAGACGSSYPSDGFPYGGRLRLKASYDTSAYTGTQALVVIRALQKYGMINTDDSGYDRADFRHRGGNWDMADLGQIHLSWSDFEVPAMAVVQSTACN